MKFNWKYPSEKEIFPRVPLSEWISNWNEQEGQDLFGNMYAVIHTSCVTYGMVELKKALEICADKFGRKDVWIVSEDCYYELRFLVRYSYFRYLRQAAQFILNHSRKTSWCMSWLNDFNRTKYELKNSDFYEKMVFLFGDAGQLEQFIQYAYGRLVAPQGSYYVLYASPEYEVSGGNILSVRQCYQKLKNHSLRNPVNNGFTNDKLRLEDTDILQLWNTSSVIFSDKPQMTFPFSELIPVKNDDGEVLSGHYGTIYKHLSVPFSYFKVYKEKPDAEFEKKLEQLLLLNNYCSITANSFPVSLPSSLIYRTDGDLYELIGYEMRAYNLTDLWKVLSETDSAEWIDEKSCIISLIGILLDLHCLHISVKDLCLENSLIKNSKDIILVDSDGFQYLNYLGSGMHRIYRHPNVNDGEMQSILFEDFAFAVFAFNLLFNENGDNIFLRECEDQFICAYVLSKLQNNPEVLINECYNYWYQNWMGRLDSGQQQLFMDTLSIFEMIVDSKETIRRSSHIHGLGEWIKSFHIIES